MPIKVKRFLLRYDPPGLGFEVSQDDGPLEIVHKDLPAVVKTNEDICAVVERLIAEEELLTRKRHGSALRQLLGRLYQVAVESGDEEEESPSASKSKPEAAHPLQEDKTVVLIGLKNDMVVHNGEVGTLTKCKHDKKKYEVMMTTGQEVKVKGEEHLVLVQPKFTSLTVGAAVVIRGLRNHTELNGCLGRVVECHEETHRFEVRATESGQLFRVKQENLVPIDATSLPAGKAMHFQEQGPAGGSPRGEKKAPLGSAPGEPGSPGEGVDDVFEAGAQVELTGLKTAMGYNGQQAEVLSVDRVRCRYEIRLADGSVKTIRAENVRLVSRASPRRRKEGGTKAADRGK